MWNILISTNHTKRMLESMSQNCFSTQPGLKNNTPSIFYYSMSCSVGTGVSFSVHLYGTSANKTLDLFLVLVDTTNLRSNTIKTYFSLCCDHFPWRVFHTSRERQMADDFGHRKGIAFLQASENVRRKKLDCLSRVCTLVISLKTISPPPDHLLNCFLSLSSLIILRYVTIPFLSAKNFMSTWNLYCPSLSYLPEAKWLNSFRKIIVSSSLALKDTVLTGQEPSETFSRSSCFVSTGISPTAK